MTTRDLFLHELKTMLWIERKLAEEVLPELREQVGDGSLRRDVEHHLAETEGHVRNVEQIFELLGLRPEAAESETLKGLRRDHDTGLKLLSGPGPVAELLHASSIARSEQAEIAAYGGLIEMAEQLREEEIANLLRENVEDEEIALRKAERAMRRLLAEEIAV
jgi:ferritin-like metal-binding protein YciE